MRLEDFIKNNQEAFNDETPEDGHFKRFEEKLGKQQVPKRNLRPLIFIAAILCGLVVGLSFFLRSHTGQPEGCVISPEMQKVQNYYSAMLDDEVETLKQTLSGMNPSIQDKVIRDALDIKNTSGDLPENFCKGTDDKKALAVVVKRYQAKIEAIQSMNTFIEENKSIK